MTTTSGPLPRQDALARASNEHYTCGAVFRLADGQTEHVVPAGWQLLAAENGNDDLLQLPPAVSVAMPRGVTCSRRRSAAAW